MFSVEHCNEDAPPLPLMTEFSKNMEFLIAVSTS